MIPLDRIHSATASRYSSASLNKSSMGPFIWNLLKRAGDRVVAAVPAQPSGYRPEMPGRSYTNDKKGWGPERCARRPDITMAMVDTFLTNMYGGEMGDLSRV